MHEDQTVTRPPDAVPETRHQPADEPPARGEQPLPAGGEKPLAAGGEKPLATVAIIAWNGASMIEECLDALAGQAAAADGAGFETWVIDNASTDGTAGLVAAHPLDARLVPMASNLGFAGAAEYVVRAATTPFVVLLNQDAIVGPGWLEALLAPMLAPSGASIAATTSKVLFADDGRLNNTGVLVARDGYGSDRGFGEPDDGRYATADDVAAFSGTAAALRAVAVRAVGSFDGAFFLYYEDTDLSWRLRRAGWRIRYVPEAVVRHRHAASSDVGSEAFAFYNERNRLWMLAKCAPWWRVAREVVRYAAITVLLPVRRRLGGGVPQTHQFRVALRVRVLRAFFAALPRLLHQRRMLRGRGKPRFGRRPPHLGPPPHLSP